MKKTILLISILLFCITAYSQTGINTENPQGIFHVDTNGDTVDSSNLKDDFIVNNDGSDGVVTSLGSNTYPSASLALGEANKGLLLNRVRLVDNRGSSVQNPIQNPVNGMVVFNTSLAGVPPYNVVVGPYVYDEKTGLWLQLNYTYNSTEISDYSLLENTTLPSLSSYTETDFLKNGTLLNLTNGGTGVSSSLITLNSDAAYAIALNLNGSTTNSNTTTPYWLTSYVYVAVVRYNNEESPEILDIAQLSPVIGRNNSVTTSNTILGFNALTGDKIGVLICRLQEAKYQWILDNTTTVSLWRL